MWKTDSAGTQITSIFSVANKPPNTGSLILYQTTNFLTGPN